MWQELRPGAFSSGAISAREARAGDLPGHAAWQQRAWAPVLLVYVIHLDDDARLCCCTHVGAMLAYRFAPGLSLGGVGPHELS